MTNIELIEVLERALKVPPLTEHERKLAQAHKQIVAMLKGVKHDTDIEGR